MSQSEAFIGFYTLLLGLGIATLLTRFAEVLRRRQLRAIGLPGALLTLLIVFEFLSAWSGSTRVFTGVEVTIASLALPFATGAAYFLATVLLYPEAGDASGLDVGQYLDAQTRTIAVLLLLANALLIAAEVTYVLERWAQSPAYFWRFYLPYNGAILLLYATIATFRGRTPRVAAMAMLLLLYGWVTATAQV